MDLREKHPTSALTNSENLCLTTVRENDNLNSTMNWKSMILLPVLSIALSAAADAGVQNLKIVTDASPDYADLPSMVHSITSKWQTPEEKCWATFYWNHIARR